MVGIGAPDEQGDSIYNGMHDNGLGPPRRNLANAKTVPVVLPESAVRGLSGESRRSSLLRRHEEARGVVAACWRRNRDKTRLRSRRVFSTMAAGVGCAAHSPGPAASLTVGARNLLAGAMPRRWDAAGAWSIALGVNDRYRGWFAILCIAGWKRLLLA